MGQFCALWLGSLLLICYSCLPNVKTHWLLLFLDIYLWEDSCHAESNNGEPVVIISFGSTWLMSELGCLYSGSNCSQTNSRLHSSWMHCTDQRTGWRARQSIAVLVSNSFTCSGKEKKRGQEGCKAKDAKVLCWRIELGSV